LGLEARILDEEYRHLGSYRISSRIIIDRCDKNREAWEKFMGVTYRFQLDAKDMLHQECRRTYKLGLLHIQLLQPRLGEIVEMLSIRGERMDVEADGPRKPE
jgi:hypothetical protein